MIKVKVNNEYKDVVKIFCGGTLRKEIIKVWSREAQKYVYESSVEYTGTLPITINANGNALLDYRIYGASGGVGEPTENLFDESTVEYDGYIDPYSGNFVSHTAWSSSDYIEVAGDYINLSGKLIAILGGWSIIHNFYDSNKSWLGGNNTMQGVGTIGQRKAKSYSISGVSYVRISYRFAIFDDIMLVEGSTEPADYIPYGYKLPMTVSDGSTVQTVPAYIGENQLDAGEYVSYGEQKIYRDVGGALTPTDPPVPLPGIPTIDGTTTIDYDGDPKPSQMYIKYRR